jgi:hypothetical protein
MVPTSEGSLPAAPSPRELPSASICRTTYSEVMRQFVCLVANPVECRYAATFDRQTFCCHPDPEGFAQHEDKT